MKYSWSKPQSRILPTDIDKDKTINLCLYVLEKIKKYSCTNTGVSGLSNELTIGYTFQEVYINSFSE